MSPSTQPPSEEGERERSREEGNFFAHCHTASPQPPLNASCKLNITSVSFTPVKIYIRAKHECLETDG